LFVGFCHDLSQTRRDRDEDNGRNSQRTSYDERLTMNILR
jgi:hypothetical protein